MQQKDEEKEGGDLERLRHRAAEVEADASSESDGGYDDDDDDSEDYGDDNEPDEDDYDENEDEIRGDLDEKSDGSSDADIDVVADSDSDGDGDGNSDGDGDGDGGSQSGSDEEDIPEASEVNEEDRDYARFLHSMFNNEDSLPMSGCSFTDDDDDADFLPNGDAHSNGGDSDDDEYDENESGVDGELVRVAKNEVQELIAGCWQTIAAVPPTIENSRHGLPGTVASLGGPQGSSSSAVHQQLSSDGEGNVLKVLGSTFKDSSASANVSVYDQNVDGTEVEIRNDAVDTDPSRREAGAKERDVGVVSQLFSGYKPSDICVDGMPVSTIRSLVTRQMSMALQLLLQLLLLSDEQSECFNKCYTSIMELSNVRDNAVKKSRLMAVALQNVAEYQNSLRSHRGHKHTNCFVARHGFDPMFLEGGDSDVYRRSIPGMYMGTSGGRSRDKGYRKKGQNAHHKSPEQLMAERRLTRSELAHLTSSPQKNSGQTGRKRDRRRVQSVFDLHCLEKIQSLFEDLDDCRRRGAEQLKQRVEEYIRSSSGESLQQTSSSSAATSLSERLRNDLLHAARAQTQPLISAGKRRTIQLELLKKDISVILEKFEMKRWECLIPNGSYPLPPEAMEKASPASLAGRAMFTPAEDDLLLRGLVTFGENWGRIRSEMLPSKEETLLKFRFSQMTLSNSPEENKFKRFIKLDREKKNRDNKWSHSEDLNLLRGFQIFGEKWPMIAIFFLPHRNKKEIKARWSTLVKEWTKSFSNPKNGRKMECSMTPSIRDFLIWLNNGRYPYVKTEDQKLESESSGPNWSINPIFGRSYSYPMQMQMQMQMQGSVSLSMSMAMPMQLQMNGYFPNYQGTPISDIRDDPYGPRTGYMLDGHGHIEEDELLSSGDEDNQNYPENEKRLVDAERSSLQQEASIKEKAIPLKRKRQNLSPEILKSKTTIVRELDSESNDEYDQSSGEEEVVDFGGRIVEEPLQVAPTIVDRHASHLTEAPEESLLSSMSFLQQINEPGFSLFGVAVGADSSRFSRSSQ